MIPMLRIFESLDLGAMLLASNLVPQLLDIPGPFNDQVLVQAKRNPSVLTCPLIEAIGFVFYKNLDTLNGLEMFRDQGIGQ